jgi:restriction system protein
MPTSAIPTQSVLMWPTLEALKELGGSARIDEINQRVIDLEGFTEEQLAIKRRPSDRMSVIEYRLAWARSGLKLIAAIENSARGVWSITETGRTAQGPEQLISAIKQWRAKYVRTHNEARPQLRAAAKALADSNEAESEADIESEIAEDIDLDWKSQVINRLLELSPGGFERLAKRLLLEANFHNVEVLGQVGDGGIDGVGTLRVSLVAFRTYFQCKRYQGSVSASAVRDFRGAMAGRGEKGLLITTGSFTSDARKEASRDGALPVELVSGDDLADLLKEYQLGVVTQMVEQVTVEKHFFDQFS